MTETYFKAVRPDGFDFYSGTVDYASLCGTGQPLPELQGGLCCGPGVYHASTEPGEVLIGGEWPCRLFRVSGEPVAADRHKRGFKTLKVLEELPAHMALGPNGQAVAALIVQAGQMTPEQIGGLHPSRSAARNAARSAALYASWDAARNAARNAARYASWDAARYAAEHANRYADLIAIDTAGDAVLALAVRDLISQEQFDVLYGPWASVFGPADSVPEGTEGS